jgi:hypothetical protein
MREQRRLSRLPHSRGEDAGVVAVGHPRQAGEEILQIDQRVFAVALARDDPGTPPYLAAFTPPQTPHASAPAPHVRRPALSAGGVHLVSPPVTPSQWLPLRHSIRLIPSRLRGPRPAVYFASIHFPQHPPTRGFRNAPILNLSPIDPNLDAGFQAVIETRAPQSLLFNRLGDRPSGR